MSRERLAAAKKLQLILVAGVGSDHIDLEAAAAAGLTVAECTGAFCQRRLSAHITGLDASREALGAKQDIRHNSCDDRNCRGARHSLLSYLKLFVPHAIQPHSCAISLQRLSGLGQVCRAVDCSIQRGKSYCLHANKLSAL